MNQAQNSAQASKVTIFQWRSSSSSALAMNSSSLRSFIFRALAARPQRASSPKAPMLSTLPPERRAIVAQLLRFLVSGALVTLLGVAVYALVALVLRWHPQVGNLLAYAVAMATGYWMHSRWSFRDHGARGRSTAGNVTIRSG